MRAVLILTLAAILIVATAGLARGDDRCVIYRVQKKTTVFVTAKPQTIASKYLGFLERHNRRAKYIMQCPGNAQDPDDMPRGLV